MSEDNTVFGLPIETGLPEGWLPLEAVVLVKCIDADGDSCWINRKTENLNSMEQLGMLNAALLMAQQDIVGRTENAD